MSVADWTIPGTMAHAERTALIDALVRSDYNFAESARLLRVGRGTIYRLMAAFDVPHRPPSDRDKNAAVPASSQPTEQAPLRRAKSAHRVDIVDAGRTEIVFENGEYLMRQRCPV